MKQLMKKELLLTMHPAAAFFPLLSAMLLIPNYPLSVTFFYSCLGAFFLCVNSRENRDLDYAAALPVKKRDLVTGRILTVVLLQLFQMALCVPCLFLRRLYPPLGNAAGMDANAALLGLGFFSLGSFNLCFFPRYYRDPAKVGAPFLLSCGAILFCSFFSEAAPHFIPFFQDRLDTPDPQFLPQKLLVLFSGAIAYLVFTLLAWRVSQKRFERLDL